jgi:hypothetical protein
MQSIIVYRNPLEAAFWESGMVFPLIMAMVAAVISVVVLQRIFQRVLGYWDAQKYVYAYLCAGSLAGGAVFYWLHI